MSPLCAMLTFKSMQTADEKINELWEFDLFVSGVGVELFSLTWGKKLANKKKNGLTAVEWSLLSGDVRGRR